MFTPKIGEDEPIFDFRIFFKGVGEKQPTREQTYPVMQEVLPTHL